MRLNFRIVLLGLLSVFLIVPGAIASHYVADCQLSLVGSTAPTSEFFTSPHGTFRNGSVIYLLRGEALTTLNVTDVGNVEIARQDRLTSLAAREKEGGVTYADGIMYVSSEAGLEIFDLRNTHGGVAGRAPTLLSRTITPHYRRLAVQGNLLAALYPGYDLPCVPGVTPGCSNSIDLYNISDLTAPVLVGRIDSRQSNSFVAFNDIAFTNGFLYTTGYGGTHAFSVANPSAPAMVRILPQQGTFLVTNGTTLLGIGQKTLIGVFVVGPGSALNQFNVYTLPSIVDRSNRLMFHQEAFFDEQNRLITMIDEEDPMYPMRPARTIAFDVFDLSIPKFEGFDDRIYESVTFTETDEVKHDPVAVGPYIYVNGEISGAQTWGACGLMSGRLEHDFMQSLTCGGAELRGWVTGTNKITRVELFLDNSSLGTARLGQQRHDVSSVTPVSGWAVNVNLDQVSRGEHTFRVVVTDVAGNTRQVHSKTMFFNGPGQNCTTRRRVGR
jgi:hypothetical protein